jgi:hypothetical protein
MKPLKDCEVRNCIPTPSGCVDWNGGDIEYLGICNGDSLNNLVWEVVEKLKSIAGEDLSTFDIEGLLDLCNAKAPQEVTLISILTLVKNNQICLKDYLDNLSSQMSEFLKESNININLRCYAEFDNLGNALNITRDTLDQLVIDNLCSQKQRIETLEGRVVSLQSQIDNKMLNTTVEELSFPTCLDPASKPTSEQVKKTSQELCDHKTAVGTSAQIASALGNTGSGWNTEFGLIPGWDLTPENLAQSYSNLLLAFNNLLGRVKLMEVNCCALSCEDIKLGFSAVFGEAGNSIILKFTYGAGTSIPNGFTDKGSTGTIVDIDGNVESFNITIANGAEEEIDVSGLNLNGELKVNIDAKLGTDGLTCDKCLSKTVKNAVCGYCEISATGAEGSSAVIVYDDAGVGNVIATPIVDEPTTTTTTTTTISP